MLKKLLGLKPDKHFIHQVAICCIVRDEEPYLIEWIDYHLKIGVGHFFIYDNESKIPVAITLSRYINNGTVTAAVLKGELMQKPCYAKCLAEHGSKCRWMAFIDIDEFIVPKTLTGNLPDFLTDYAKYGGLGVNWLVFGSNGHITHQQGQIHPYTKRTLKSHPINGHIKSIVQPRYVKTHGPNAHQFSYKKGWYCVNENFVRIDHAIVPHTSNKIQLNHYNLRSLDEYKEKVKRGNPDSLEARHPDYFYNHDKDANIITDESIIELEMLLSNPK